MTKHFTVGLANVIIEDKEFLGPYNGWQGRKYAPDILKELFPQYAAGWCFLVY